MPLQVIDYGLIQTDFMNPKNRKNIQYKAPSLLQSIQKKKFPPFFLLFVLKKVIFFEHGVSTRR